MIRRIVRLASVIGFVAGAFALGWWGALQVTRPPSSPVAAAEPVTVVAENGTVGRSIALAAAASWPTDELVVNRASGIVTDVLASDAVRLRQGDVVYLVDERPVTVIRGRVPWYREVAHGDRGRDVAQLQQMLADTGLLSGAVDGVFGPTTAAAVRRWQHDLGIRATGRVGQGDVVAVPELPVRATVSERIQRGARLGGGEPALQALRQRPRFWLPISVDQRDLVPLSGQVRITVGEDVWDAQIDRALETRDGEIELLLRSADDEPICGDECDEHVEVGRQTTFPAEVVVVPEMTGVVVPTAAILTGPNGGTTVRLADGDEVDVEVIVSSDGRSVVEGIEPGVRVRLPSEPAPPDRGRDGGGA